MNFKAKFNGVESKIGIQLDSNLPKLERIEHPEAV